ncbi:ATP-dependent DNA helicase PIF1 [Mytilus galloprovincialis]|uniref:ATP-dependent DNA helicase PIF1 n=1 Tax=Mytilus galloprovincialis TaxID=29158 RepID=A0A8B6CXV6_MYTGA|nr:ATP-dependent DNA helicase PIF1 [Mytilus galloprovincialis]
MIKDVCQQTVKSKAKDFFKNSLTGQLSQKDEPYSTYTSEDLQDVIELGIFARIMLIRNIDTTDGLVNGAFGSITGIEKSQNDEIRAVYVKFDHPESGKKHISKLAQTKSLPKDSVRISPVEEVLHGKNVTRKQLPLRLGWAATIHKVQGMTVKEIVVSLKRTFAPGMAYVALSRVSSLKEDITIALDSMESFHLAKAATEPSVEHSLTITFHNTEGLLPHKEDITQATVMKNADIICFNETWLKKETYLPPSLLPDFILCSKSRSEAYTSTSPYSTLAAAERGGVATLSHKDIEKPTKLVLINIYRPPVYPLQLFCHNLDHLLDEVDSKENLPVAIIGDFNDNVFQLNSKILELLTNYGYKQIVQQMTTESGSCLDLVFVKNFGKCPTCTVIPIYYSFHDVVQIYFD